MAKKRAKTNPLFQHRNGQWAKKLHGKLVYFGTDQEAALQRWREEMDDLKAGRAPARKDTNPTLAQLGNVYFARCRNLVSTGELTQRTLDDSKRTIERLIKIRGATDRPTHWTATDFAEIKVEFAKPVPRSESTRKIGMVGRPVAVRSPGTLAGDIRRIKAFLNWASSEGIEHIPRPKYGADFSVSKKTLRKSRASKGRLDLPADEVRAIIERASVQFRPVVLLAINCGYGARDVAAMTLAQVESCLSDPWLSVPRGKTGAERRAWLWPETQAAIRDYLETRKRPHREEFEEIGFLTSRRRPWLEEQDGAVKDTASWTFTRIRKDLGYARGSFYDLRRTLATIGSETLEQVAVDFIMGHLPDQSDMAAIYRQHISDDRIKKVCAHVRKWLFPVRTAR